MGYVWSMYGRRMGSWGDGETWGWVLGFWNADLTDSLM